MDQNKKKLILTSLWILNSVFLVIVGIIHIFILEGYAILGAIFLLTGLIGLITKIYTFLKGKER